MKKNKRMQFHVIRNFRYLQGITVTKPNVIIIDQNCRIGKPYPLILSKTIYFNNCHSNFLFNYANRTIFPKAKLVYLHAGFNYEYRLLEIMRSRFIIKNEIPRIEYIYELKT